jgi:hypothetical protein
MSIETRIRRLVKKTGVKISRWTVPLTTKVSICRQFEGTYTYCTVDTLCTLYISFYLTTAPCTGYIYCYLLMYIIANKIVMFFTVFFSLYCGLATILYLFSRLSDPQQGYVKIFALSCLYMVDKFKYFCKNYQ